MGTTQALDTLQGFFRRPGPDPAGDVLLDEPGPEAGDLELDDTTEIPVIPAACQVSYWQQIAGMTRHTWRAARRAIRESHEREGSFLQQQKAVQYSYDGLCEYADSRAYVPDGHAGGLVERLGDLYFMIAKRKAAYHLAQLYKCWRPLRQLVWWTAKYLAVMGLLLFTGHGILAAAVTAGVLVILALAVIIAAPRRAAPAPAEEDTETDPDSEGETGDLT